MYGNTRQACSWGEWERLERRVAINARETHIREIDGKWYAYEWDSKGEHVLSIGNDNPKDGRWFANHTDRGIKYVACPSPTRRAAYQKARRWGIYKGEW